MENVSPDLDSRCIPIFAMFSELSWGHYHLELELLAAIFSFHFWNDIVLGRFTVHFDDDAVRSILINGIAQGQVALALMDLQLKFESEQPSQF